jgi:hypothetical protein
MPSESLNPIGPAITPLSSPVISPSEPATPTPPPPRLAAAAIEAPAANSGPAIATNGPAPAATGPALAANGPAAATNGPAVTANMPVVTPGAPVPAVLQQPLSPVRTASLPTDTPRHPIAPGLSAGARVTLKIDTDRSVFTLETTQGVLYSATAPQGVPVGETLSTPLAQLQRDQLEHGELRVYSGDQPITAVTGAALEKLLRGEPAAVGPLRPGDYQLCWWNPDTGLASPAVLSLRLAGF